MIRITYIKNEAGTVLTTKEALARNKVINANILIKDDGCHYVVTDLGAGTVLASGVCKNVTSAKREVKNAFRALGVVISGEARKKL